MRILIFILLFTLVNSFWRSFDFDNLAQLRGKIAIYWKNNRCISKNCILKYKFPKNFTTEENLYTIELELLERGFTFTIENYQRLGLSTKDKNFYYRGLFGKENELS